MSNRATAMAGAGETTIAGAAATEIAGRASTFTPTLDLLPTSMRLDAMRLYLALRRLDDLVDDREPEATSRVQAAELWCVTREPASPETVEFERLARTRGLRPETVATFCAAMRHDLERDRIETDFDLETYCGQVAGAVGVMFAEVAGASDPRAAEKALALGKAIQLTHILRDIDLDLADGRIYMSQESIERHGSLLPGERESLLRAWIEVADAWFDEGLTGIAMLPVGRSWVAASAGLYRETLREIERAGYGRTAGRVEVSRSRQRAIIVEAVAAYR